MVTLDDVLKAFILHELHGGLHAVQQGQHRCVGRLPILIGLDHVFQVKVYPLQLGFLAHRQSLHDSDNHDKWQSVSCYQLDILLHPSAEQTVHGVCLVLPAKAKYV